MQETEDPACGRKSDVAYIQLERRKREGGRLIYSDFKQSANNDRDRRSCFDCSQNKKMRI